MKVGGSLTSSRGVEPHLRPFSSQERGGRQRRLPFLPEFEM